jgi:hypothetical protein
VPELERDQREQLAVKVAPARAMQIERCPHLAGSKRFWTEVAGNKVQGASAQLAGRALLIGIA